MGGIVKPLVLNDPKTGKPGQVIPLSTIGVNPSDPGPDYTNPSAIAQVTNDPTAFPAATPPSAAHPPAPAPAAAPPAAPSGPPAASSSGLLAGPGAYEQWIKDHLGQLDNPTRNETLYDTGGASSLNNSPLNNVAPVQGGSYAAWLAAQGGAPTAGNSANVLGQLSSGPTSGPTVGNSSSVLSGLTHGPTNGPATGASAGVLGSLATGPSNSTNVYGQASGALSDPGAMEQFNAMYGGGNGDLMSPGYTEKLYDAGIGQLDPFYDYAQKRALQAAQTASSARGGFNSGLAAQQESDIVGNLRGQQAQEQASLAPQADAARIAREGLASGEANNAQSQEQNRLSTLSGIASAGDAADLGRNQLRSTTANNVDTNSTNAFNAYWNQLNNADSNLVSAGHNADSASTDAFQAEWNARNNAGQNLISAGQNADQSAINSFTAGSTAQNNSEQTALSEWLANAGLAGQQDTANRANTEAQFNLATGADASQNGRLIEQGGLAKDLQSTGQNRVLGGLSATSGEATQEATLTQQILSDTKGIDQMDDTQLQALAAKYGVSVDEVKSIAGDATAAAGLATSLLTKGGIGGGAVAQPTTTTLGANGSPILD